MVPILVATVAAGCGTSTPPLNVSIDTDGRLMLTTSCFRDVDIATTRANGQIVVTDISGDGPKDGDCASGVTTDEPAGPDVVYPAGEQRFALVGDRYREVDYCGVSTKRCVPFSTDVVPASCSEESVRFATIGELRGVYPFEIVRCDDRFLMVDLDPCAGDHGSDGRSCDGHLERVLYERRDGRWDQTVYRQDLMCPASGTGYRPPEMPSWVCDP